MLFKAVIVLGAIVACQGAPFYPQNAEEVRTAIDLFREASNAAMVEGSKTLKPLLDEIAVSSVAAEEKGHELVHETMQLAYRQINLSEEEANNEGIDAYVCIDAAREELPILLKRLSKMVMDCGSDARRESNGLVNEVLETSGSEAYYKRKGYYNEMDICIKQENEACLNDILAVVNEDTQVFPKELLKRFDQTESSLGDVEKDMDKCIQNVYVEASDLTEKVVINMNECIKTLIP
ncbi:PREDICTED: uncharacterized protein LOC108562980 [Nicrophorus vespilloides]|uniref:Uncharacterized protein LOC108562980 n=1 Tax=Nicrophorus vespilloides TaxID=110193 RepID=A0ABM1MQY6_NICVS|nr:PREDICTED: uncharacterized protein LOC108562980 [Nicrophorus vespilloides]